MTPHTPGLQLCRTFFAEAVEPLIARECPGLRYAAARLGPGSDVLGFDTARSVDHDWGPRLEIFCTPADLARHGERLSSALAHRLPTRFHGWPTHFVPPDARVRTMADTDSPVAHLVRFAELPRWCTHLLGFDATAGVTTFDWLATPAQRLAEVTRGAVYRDDDGDLTALRRTLRWYPEDVWRYVLACQWQRIAQEEAFVGRAAETGDETGGRVLTARLARDVMRLCLLLARQDRPYPVIDAGRFADALAGQLTDVAVRALPRIGAVDQVVDSTEVLSAPAVGRAVMAAALTPDPDPSAPRAAT